MMGIKIARQGLFAAVTALALGFGALEALAAPGAPDGTASACTAAFAVKCNGICETQGWDYGTCDAATGRCLCWRYPAK